MGGLHLYNTLTRSKELFTMPAGKDYAGLYVCGITPYDTTHLGHAFTYTFFDVLARYLNHLGHNVRYTQNLTDIDDDMIRKSKELNTDYRSLGEKNANQFLSDMAWLNNNPPSIYCRATDHIEDMTSMISKLISSGHAYESAGNVYYDKSAFPNFGRLSGLSEEEMIPISAQRGNDIHDTNKKNPLDFLLWSAAKPGEPNWESPFGKGRPGWHIECSAMSTRYLGNTVDIHGGGGDLVFPHHECEIAQSESASGSQFVRYWLHTGMLRYQGEKMSKSLGNLVFIGKLKKEYSPNEIRLLLLSQHYRSEWEFDEQMLSQARNKDKLFRMVFSKENSAGRMLDISGYRSEFYNALDNDMDTPAALNSLDEMCLETIIADHSNISSAKEFLNEAQDVLGLRAGFF